MALRLPLLRPKDALALPGLCVFCQSQQLVSQPSRQHALQVLRPASVARDALHRGQSSRRQYATTQHKVSPTRVVKPATASPSQQRRLELDRRARKGYFTFLHNRKQLPVDAKLADKIIADVLALENMPDIGEKVSSVAEKHRIDVRHITLLGIATAYVPKADAPGIPPPQHFQWSRIILLACSKAGDALATCHVAAALTYPSNAIATGLVQTLSAADGRYFRAALKELAEADDDAEVLAMQAAILAGEQGGLPKAIAMAKRSVDLKVTEGNLEYKEDEVNPLTFQMIVPWLYLGHLLRGKGDVANAKEAYEIGVKADDPMACYFYADLYEEEDSFEWLQLMSRAAASGVADAQYKLGQFYVRIDSRTEDNVKKEYMEDNRLAKVLGWLAQGGRQFNPEKLGVEWLQLGMKGLHKPCMMKLAEIYLRNGDLQAAAATLQKLKESPPAADSAREEFPELVTKAHQMLVKLKSQGVVH